MELEEIKVAEVERQPLKALVLVLTHPFEMLCS